MKRVGEIHDDITRGVNNSEKGWEIVSCYSDLDTAHESLILTPYLFTGGYSGDKGLE